MTGRIAVIGNGMAAARFVDQMRELGVTGPDAWQITVYSSEPRPAYNRILLSEVVDGRVAPGALAMVDETAWRESGIALRLASTVVEVDPARKLLRTAAGQLEPFDICVFATGSRPFIPPLAGLPANVADPGAKLPAGVLTFRTIDDALALVGWSSRAGRVAGHRQPRAVVLGGGLLGLEAAKGISGRGIDTTVVHMADHLMERQLDPAAGAILKRAFNQIGVDAVTGAAAQEVRLSDGAASAVVLADGSALPADLVIISAGVKPNVEVARSAGLAVGRGIQVNNDLRALDNPNFFAIGECAEHQGTVYGLVAPAWEQADHAAAVIAGQPTGGGYQGSRVVTRLKTAGIGVASMGNVTADSGYDQPGVEVVTISDPARGTYKKLVVTNDRLTGAILLGDVTAAGGLAQAFDRQNLLPPNRLALLLGRDSDDSDDATRIPDRATICRCNGVTKQEICAAFLDGSHTVEAVAERTRATTGCGGCRDSVSGIVGWMAQAEQGSHPDSGKPTPEQTIGEETCVSL